MHKKLVEILEVKKREVERLKKAGHPAPISSGSEDRRDFEKALTSGGGIHLIAEIKFSSPSAGIIRGNSDPVAIGQAYEQSGAAAISLLTDRTFFKGDIKDLPKLKQMVSLPILRKDFIIDEIQIMESARFGADAVLLIARILSVDQLKSLLCAAREYGIKALIEIHDEEDLEKALDCNAKIIGINNRDLDTFEISLNTTHKLAPLIPSDKVLVSESGIHTDQDMTAFMGLNIHAALVGSALMGADNPGKKAMEMVKAGKRA